MGKYFLNTENIFYADFFEKSYLFVFILIVEKYSFVALKRNKWNKTYFLSPSAMKDTGDDLDGVSNVLDKDGKTRKTGNVTFKCRGRKWFDFGCMISFCLYLDGTIGFRIKLENCAIFSFQFHRRWLA